MNPINKLQYDGIKFNYLENSPRWASHALRMLNKLAWAARSSFMWKKSPDITGQHLVGGSRGGDGGRQSSPWAVITRSLSQQVVFAWETLPLSVDSEGGQQLSPWLEPQILPCRCTSQVVSAANGDYIHPLSSDGSPYLLPEAPWVVVVVVGWQSGERAYEVCSLTSEVHLSGHQPSSLTILFLHPLPVTPLHYLLPQSSGALPQRPLSWPA